MMIVVAEEKYGNQFCNCTDCISISTQQELLCFEK